MEENFFKNKLAPNFIFSQSSLQDYMDCNRRFQLRYIMQLKWPAVETAPVLENERRQAEGQQFHRLVQQYLLGLPEDKISFSANHSSGENLSRWWGHFLEQKTNSLSDLQGAEYAAEHSLSAPIGRHRIIAKYDLIASKNGKTSIYDWKTYHIRPKNEKMAGRLQTRVYQSLLVQAGGHLNRGKPVNADTCEMIYWYADFPEEPARFSYSQAQAKKDWEVLTGLVNEISAKQSFPLTPDAQKCGFCLYRSFCERGTHAQNGEDTEILSPEDWDVNMEQVQEIEF